MVESRTVPRLKLVKAAKPASGCRSIDCVSKNSSEMSLFELQRLHEIEARLLEEARSLPYGPDRRELLQRLGPLVMQIALLRAAASRQSR